MRITTQEIYTILCNASLLVDSAKAKPSCVEPSCVHTQVTTDSRTIQQGAVFVCLIGKTIDAHTLVPQAIESGATAIIGEKPVQLSSAQATACYLQVTDAVKALGAIALWHRQRTKAKVIGITGSAGKTTVKELLASILQEQGTVAKNPLNLNNQIGLPLSMLNTTGSEDFWIFEIGISQPHDMAELSAILQPDIALIINAGSAHLEGLGKEGVAKHKASLLNNLAPNGIGIINALYPDLVAEAQKTNKPCRYYGLTQDSTGNAAYYATYPPAHTAASALTVNNTFGIFEMHLGTQTFTCQAPLRGALGAENVAAVCTVAEHLGVSVAAMQQGLKKAQLPEHRNSITQLGAFTLIDDTYNANPVSSKYMIEFAKNCIVEKQAQHNETEPLILVMGDMLELGADAQKEHTALGMLIQTVQPHAVFWKGSHAADVAAGFTAQTSIQFFQTPDTQTFINTLATLNLTKGTFLFKGSRSNKLEDFFQQCNLYLKNAYVL